MIESCCSAQNSNRRCLLSLQFPIPHCPRTPFQATLSQPTLTLKFPKMTIIIYWDICQETSKIGIESTFFLQDLHGEFGHKN